MEGMRWLILPHSANGLYGTEINFVSAPGVQNETRCGGTARAMAAAAVHRRGLQVLDSKR